MSGWLVVNNTHLQQTHIHEQEFFSTRTKHFNNVWSAVNEEIPPPNKKANTGQVGGASFPGRWNYGIMQNNFGGDKMSGEFAKDQLGMYKKIQLEWKHPERLECATFVFFLIFHVFFLSVFLAGQIFFR